jgi:hypothetical protein
MPSPVDDPTWQSFTPSARGYGQEGPLTALNRNTSSASFRAKTYAEAQIHGGVRVSDIAEVIFSSVPNAALKKQLAESGVAWRVLTAKGTGK